MQERFDRILHTLGVTRSRSEAEDLIKRGLVSVRGVVVLKPAKMFDATALTKEDIEISTKQYVSRGAYKLLKAFELWNIDVTGKTAIDIGSSTGGFTEVLLEKGATKVYAVDVGTDQLHPSLKSNEKVVSLEQSDIQTLQELPERVDVFVSDISFVSLTKIIPHLNRFVKESATGVLLVKPQFEVGKEYISKGGIVKNERAVHNALTNIKNILREHGYRVLQEADSPILGGSGNKEYLWLITKNTP